MKIVIAVLMLTPMFSHALTNEKYRPIPPCGDYVDDCIPRNPKPRPLPFPRPCPRPWDDCTNDPYRPLTELREKTAGLSRAVADGKLDKAGERLDALFMGAGSGKSSAMTVSADVKENPNPPTIFYPDAENSRSVGRYAGLMVSGRSSSGPRIVRVGAEGALIGGAIGAGATGGSAVGAGGGAYIGDKAQDAAGNAIDRYVNRDRTQDSIKEYGGCRLKGTCSK